MTQITIVDQRLDFTDIAAAPDIPDTHAPAARPERDRQESKEENAAADLREARELTSILISGHLSE